MVAKGSELSIFKSLRMQILSIVAASLMAGLWMNYNFLISIEARLSVIEKNIDKMDEKNEKLMNMYLTNRKPNPNF